ncbi:MAG: hypothetical protein ABJE47_12370 [bacterium]
MARTMRDSGSFSSISQGAATRRRRILAVAIPVGMIVGGELQKVGRLYLPVGAVKSFFTSGLTGQTATAWTLEFLYGTATIGPIAIDVSLFAVLGALLIVRMALAMFD